MPKYQVVLSDGRKFAVEADSQPTEQDVMAKLGLSTQPPTASVTDTAVDALPFAGGMVGSLVGAGKWNPLGMGGAALGGGAGEAARQLINRIRGAAAPSTSEEAASDIGAEAVKQAGLQGAGQGAFRLIRGVLKSPLARAAVQGAAEHIPGIGPMARGAIDAVRKRAGELAASRGGQLATEKVPALNDTLTNILEDIRTTPESPMRTGMAKTPTGRLERGAVSPQQFVPEMVARLPDKWGATVISRTTPAAAQGAGKLAMPSEQAGADVLSRELDTPFTFEGQANVRPGEFPPGPAVDLPSRPGRALPVRPRPSASMTHWDAGAGAALTPAEGDLIRALAEQGGSPISPAQLPTAWRALLDRQRTGMIQSPK